MHAKNYRQPCNLNVKKKEGKIEDSIKVKAVNHALLEQR